MYNEERYIEDTMKVQTRYDKEKYRPGSMKRDTDQVQRRKVQRGYDEERYKLVNMRKGTERCTMKRSTKRTQ